MPEVIYRDGRGAAQSKETAPTRTVTTVFYGGTQQREGQKGDANE